MHIQKVSYSMTSSMVVIQASLPKYISGANIYVPTLYTQEVVIQMNVLNKFPFQVNYIKLRRYLYRYSGVHRIMFCVLTQH